jgi:hypothetical protein
MSFPNTFDLNFGSALDIFGGSGVMFEELVHWNSNIKRKVKVESLLFLVH